MSKNDNIRKAICELINLASEENVTFGDDDKTKYILKNHKDAFVAASDMIIGLFEKESASSGGVVDSLWYTSTLKDLIKAGESTVKVMNKGINSSISRASQERTNSDIQAKREAFIDIRLMEDKIAALKLIIEMNKEKSDSDFVIKKEEDHGITGYCLRYAE